MAPTSYHAFDFLQQDRPESFPPVLAVVGPDRFLKRLIFDHLHPPDAEDDNLLALDGGNTTWNDVRDELSVVSLFGTGPRHVLLTDADNFVSQHRSALEEYTQNPLRSGVLILDLASLPGNTRLYKQIVNHGLLIASRLPEAARGRGIDTGRVRKWLEHWGRHRHGIQLSRAATDELTELIGWELGLLDQELAKLALFAKPNVPIDANLVRQVVGGWRVQTTWEMLDAAAGGDAAQALQMLDQLLQAGEVPQALFGSIAWSLRRFAIATRNFQRLEQSGRQRPDLSTALAQAGFRTKPPAALEKAREQLLQIGRQRGSQLLRWLLETDLALKGTHSSPQRGRIALEMLIFRLARGAKPSATR